MSERGWRSEGASPLIVLDGHDGSGKTTLAAGLAEILGWVHIRPFAGAAGECFLAAARRRAFELASELAREAVDHALEPHADSPSVVDRHWMTAFSVLPEIYWAAWYPLPPTTLCFADLETTLLRLELRDGETGASTEHAYYLSTYRDLARRFGCHMLRTDRLSSEGALERLRAWVQQV